jgi:hypothetical protein
MPRINAIALSALILAALVPAPPAGAAPPPPHVIPAGAVFTIAGTVLGEDPATGALVVRPQCRVEDGAEPGDAPEVEVLVQCQLWVCSHLDGSKAQFEGRVEVRDGSLVLVAERVMVGGRVARCGGAS